jgi:hypothetical protein
MGFNGPKVVIYCNTRASFRNFSRINHVRIFGKFCLYYA